MNVEECNLDWFKGSLVARVHEVGNIQNIKELFVVEGYQSIKLRHLGDNLIILTSMDKADLKECLRGSEEWLSEIFESIDNWSEETTMEFRLTWVRISNVSLKVWRQRCFEQIVYARVLIHTTTTETMDFTQRRKTNGKLHMIKMVEETILKKINTQGLCERCMGELWNEDSEDGSSVKGLDIVWGFKHARMFAKPKVMGRRRCGGGSHFSVKGWVSMGGFEFLSGKSTSYF